MVPFFFLTKTEPTLTHHNHLNSIHSLFTFGFTLGVVHAMRLNTFIRTYVHHYYIAQSIFTVLKIICVLSVLSALPPLATSDLFYLLHHFAFSRMPYIWNHTVCSLFRLASLLSNMYLKFLGACS